MAFQTGCRSTQCMEYSQIRTKIPGPSKECFGKKIFSKKHSLEVLGLFF